MPNKEGRPILGWTGTRNLNEKGKRYIMKTIASLNPRTIIVTGGCIGVDAFVAEMAHHLGLFVYTVLPADHSRVDPRWKEWSSNEEQMAEGTTYKDRNKRVVALSDSLAAVPDYSEGHDKSKRSGTWQTIRLAKERGKPVRFQVQNQEN